MTKKELDNAIQLGARTTREMAWINKIEREIKHHLSCGRYATVIRMQNDLLKFRESRVSK